MSIERIKPSFHFEAERIQQLKQIAPEAFADGKINWESLQEALGTYLEEEDITSEHFGLFWPGKRAARKIASIPSEGTLIPCPGDGIDEESTENIFIEGENLEVLKLLQKSYANRIKMIYIDPPYNTGKDLIYEDDFTESIDEYLRRTGQIDEEAKPLSVNAKSDGRFHSKWLSMMYPRLRLARNLLKDDGILFISIDNNEVHNLRAICNEIFGEENFIECISWNKRIPKNDKGIGSIHEYILIYVKNSSVNHEFIMQKDGLEEIDELLSKLKKSKTTIPEAEQEIKKFYKKKGYDRGITLYNSLDENYKLWGKINMSWPNADTFGPRYKVYHPGNKKEVKIPERGWRWKQETFDDAANIVDGKYENIIKLHDGSYICGRIWFDKDEKTQPSSINYLDEVDTFLLRSILSLKSDGGIEVEKLFEGKSYFSYPKPTSLIKILLKSIKDLNDEIILDFFAGSGTTAHAIMDLNAEDGVRRKFICVQLPELLDEESEAGKAGYFSLADLSKERIRRVSKEINKLQPSREKNKKSDNGFKCYSLQSSNFKIWKNYTGTSLNELELQFEKSTTPLVEDWVPQNLLTEILLIEGFLLDSKLELQLQFKKNEVTMVTSDFCEHKLLICLDKKVYSDTIKNLHLNEDDVFICLDSAITDQDKVTLQDKGLIKTI